MTKTSTQAAALVLSALMTLATVAGMNGIATKQYAAAESLALAQSGQTQVVLDNATVAARRA
jgi:ABC-type amino acid transport system permease subunit